MWTIDLNADLGEGFGPWTMGDDEAMLGIVSSANVACGGHASDPDTMARTLQLARARGVVTYSSGNHAQAVALAAREFGVAIHSFDQTRTDAAHSYRFGVGRAVAGWCFDCCSPTAQQFSRSLIVMFSEVKSR